MGLLSQNMPNWGVAYFATAAFGGISVPMLPDFSESEIKHILKHSEAKALFVSRKLQHKVLQKAVDRLDVIICLDDFSIIKGEPIASEPAPLPSEEEIQPDDLAAIIYTSGTTGSSKGVTCCPCPTPSSAACACYSRCRPEPASTTSRKPPPHRS